VWQNHATFYPTPIISMLLFTHEKIPKDSVNYFASSSSITDDRFFMAT
jgi:hypothetical protein